jgi:hypothetical protein
MGGEIVDEVGHSITNVIEFESETSAAGVADKVAQFNESSRRMI